MRNAGDNGVLHSQERNFGKSDRKIIILSPGFGEFDSIANKLESGQYEKKDILICTFIAYQDLYHENDLSSFTGRFLF